MKGYQKKFLKKFLALPVIGTSFPKNDISKVLDYTNFSILVSYSRAQPIFTAVNIDGEKYKQSKRKKGDKWNYDMRVKEDEQLGDWFYKNTDSVFHRGHMVRRLDPCWGSLSIRKKAELDTFHFTNASPQHKSFNPKV